MIPLQEINFHTDKKVFYKVDIIKLAGSSSFSVEVNIYDSEFQPPFHSLVSFHQFQDAKAAFGHALSWINAHASKHGYAVKKINNPCNCEFLGKDEQQTEVTNAGLSVQVQVNGA